MPESHPPRDLSELSTWIAQSPPASTGAEAADVTTADAFARCVIGTICGASVTPSVGQRVTERCLRALAFGATARVALRHAGKAEAVDRVWRDRHILYRAYCAASDKVAFLGTLPWIGDVTVRHLARRLGLVVPDRHLRRLADTFATTPQALCEGVAVATGRDVATVAAILTERCASTGLGRAAHLDAA